MIEDFGAWKEAETAVGAAMQRTVRNRVALPGATEPVLSNPNEADVDSRLESPLGHGVRQLPAVTVDTYNEELRDDDGFVGDRASRRAFRAILADWRERLQEIDEDPLGDTPMEEVSKAKLDKMMASEDPKAAALAHTVVEEFASELATVMRRFVRLETWKDTQRIVLGGGLIASRIGLDP